MPRFTPEQIRRRRLIAVVLAVLLVAGTTLVLVLVFSSGVSRDEFIEQADAICRSHLVEGQALGSTDLSETAELLTTASDELAEQTQEISALEAPEEDAGVLREWLDSQRDLETTLRAAAEGAETGRQEAFDEAMAGVNQVAARSTNLAVEYGFEICGVTSE